MLKPETPLALLVSVRLAVLAKLPTVAVLTANVRLFVVGRWWCSQTGKAGCGDLAIAGRGGHIQQVLIARIGHRLIAEGHRLAGHGNRPVDDAEVKVPPVYFALA